MSRFRYSVTVQVWPVHIQRQLRKLSPSQAEAFGQLYSSTRRLEKWRGADRFAASDALERLLIDGRLTRNVDSQGDTLLDNLVDLQRNESIGKTYRRDLVGWTLAHVAFPKKSFDQVPEKGTCAPTVLFYDMALEAPAEFVRVVDDLASDKREVMLANGEVMKRAAGTLQNGSREGSPVERMLQASLMGFARPEDGYSLADDAFRQGENTGLLPEQVIRAVSALTGREARAEVIGLDALRQLVKATNGRAPVVIRWDDDPDGKHNYHMVMVTALSDQHVYYRNPWGRRMQDEQGQPIGRQVFKNGFERMELDRFEKRLEWAVVPADFEFVPQIEPEPRPAEPVLPARPEPPKGFFGRLWDSLFKPPAPPGDRVEP